MSRDSRRRAWQAKQQRLSERRAALAEQSPAVVVPTVQIKPKEPSWLRAVIGASGTAIWIALAAWSYAAATAGDMIAAEALLTLGLIVAVVALMASVRYGAFQNKQRLKLNLSFAALIAIGSGGLFWWEYHHMPPPGPTADEIATKVAEKLPHNGFIILRQDDPSLQDWLHQSFASIPWPEIVPPEKIAPALVVNGEGDSLLNVKVTGGGDAIVVNSGHNTLNHVEAIGGHSGINLQGPGFNSLNDVKAFSGDVTITHPATLEASGHSNIDAAGAQIPGDLPNQFARATDYSSINMPGAVITKNLDGSITEGPSHIAFPSPTGEFTGLSNTALKDKMLSTASSLRDFHNQFVQALLIPYKQLSDKQREEIGIKYHDMYADKFSKVTLSLASEAIPRIGTIESSSLPTEIQEGALVVHSGTFAGPRAALTAAEFLEMLASRLK
jgi:hypothetical protein